MTSINMPKIKIHFSFFLVLIINLLMNNFRLYLLTLFVFFFHELGHLVLILFKKGKIKKLSFFALGAYIDTNIEEDLLVDFGRHRCKYNFMFN